MSRANYTLLSNYLKILKDGEWDTDSTVRTKWEDGTPAHTVKLFGVVNRYNLREEFPIASVRKLNWKGAIDELLWIWQKKSNNVKDLCSGIWDQWANKGEHPDQEIGSIGKAYGFQLGQKRILTKSGERIDQVDYVLNELKNNPANRRILTEIFNHGELHEMNLAPCVHMATFNVTNGVLNMTLVQRSNDTLAAGAWNVVQYAALLCMMAQATGLKAGEMLHVVTDSHIYDKHVPMVMNNIYNYCSLIQKRLFENKVEELKQKVDDYDAAQALYEILSILKDVDFEAAAEIAHESYHTDIMDYQKYLEGVKQSSAFKVADKLIKRMIEYTELDKALGFYSPKLVLDPNVDDFYKFVSPKMRPDTDISVENGKFIRASKAIDNPNSSFDIVDYHPEIEGTEFDVRVPVAE